MARVWDALLSEGPKILYRVALVLLKDASAEILASDNPGDMISAIKASCHSCHDRDALMKARSLQLCQQGTSRLMVHYGRVWATMASCHTCGRPS